MRTNLRESPLTDRSPLDVAEHVFQLLACAPGGLALDGQELTDELPQRPIPLTELRDLLSSRTLCDARQDVVWRELVIRARRDGPQWLVGAIGVAMPALRRICGRLCLYLSAGKPADIDTEVLNAFLTALKGIDIDQPNLLPRMRTMAGRAGERARRNAEAEAGRHIAGPASGMPAASWGHPGLVLADAATKSIVSELDTELIGLTRLESRTLTEAAAVLGLISDAAKTRRQRRGSILADAVLASDVAFLPPSLNLGAPRRRQDVPKTSARSWITSDPEPINTEPKGGRGSPTGSARTPSLLRRCRWRRLLRGTLLAAVVAVVLATMAAAALAESPPSPAALLSAAVPPKDLNTVFDNLRNWLIGLLAGLATLMLTIGGLRYLVAGGDPGEVQKAKAALKAAAFGYGLAVLAPLFVSVLKRIVGGG